MGTRSYPGVKSGRGVTLTLHSLLVPWSWKIRAIPLLTLWAVRPVQSLSTCTRVHFTFYLSFPVRIESRWGARFSVPVQTGPGAHTAWCTMGIGSFPGVKSGRDVTLNPHSLLVPWSWKSRAILLPPYGPYGLYRASVPVQGWPLHFISVFLSVFAGTVICQGLVTPLS